ncbi:MAG: fibronectin type III domain-containing protein, partial [Acidimicrobiales bacterium]
MALTGLSPSTTYCYRPLASGGVDLLGSNSSPVFTTLDPVGGSQPLSFDVVGDLGETLQSASVPFPNNLNPDQAAIDSLIGSSGARFAVTAGDVAYSGGSETDYGDLQQSGSEVSDIFGPSYWPETQGLPTFGAVGNHGQNVDSLRVWPESATAQASSGTYAFDSYPALPADGTTATTSPDAWYAFSTGNVRMYVLDAAWADGDVGTSNLYQVDHDEHWTTSSPEYKWLAADLAAHPGGVKMAVFHFPLRSDNSTQSSDTNLQNTSSNPNSLESLLSGNGVKVVFNGHAHTYQRIAPSASGDVVNYVTGGGGAILEPVSGGSSCSAFTQSGSIYAIGWSPTSNTGTACGGAPTPASAAQVFNFLKVTVSGNTVTVSPTNAAGQVFDQQSYTYPGSSFPATIIDSAPSAFTSSTSASISFHSSPAGATFTCSLDGATPTACTSPATYNGLAQGPHTFSVVGTNSSGSNPSPTTTSWTVDTSPPSTPTNLKGTAVSSHEIDLTWSQSSDNTGVTGYDVLRNGSPIATVSGSTLSFADTTVAPSTTYQYAVDARDGAGNVSPPSSPPVPVTTPAAAPGPVFVQG